MSKTLHRYSCGAEARVGESALSREVLKLYLGGMGAKDFPPQTKS